MLLFALSAAAAFVGPAAPAARPVAPRARVMRACDAAGPPALRLSGTVPGDEAAAWLGLYRRARPGPVAGRPAYQNTNLPNRWLVWTGVEWVCELEADLPWSNMYGSDMRSHFDGSGADVGYLRLDADVPSPDAASTGWRARERPGAAWTDAPLTCEALTEAELASAEAEAKTKMKRRVEGDLPYLEVCHCTSCGRQGAEQVLHMFRHLGADAVPTCTRGACGTGPLVYIGKSDLTMGGLSYGSEPTKKAWKVRTAADGAAVLGAAGGKSPRAETLKAYESLLESYSTSWRLPSGAAALSAAEAALADKTAWEGCDGGMAAALARRGRLRLEAGGDWRAAEADARAAKELDSEAEEPRWLLAEIMYRSRRRQEGDRELDDLEPMLLERRDQVERRRAKLSGGLMRSDYEAEVTSLPRRRREAIEGARRRFEFAPPLSAMTEEVEVTQEVREEVRVAQRQQQQQTVREGGW